MDNNNFNNNNTDSIYQEDLDKGNKLSGILGAFLGAIIGVIPWFLASTFANFFIGYLAFLTGLASFFGYKLFKGYKSNKFATTTIIICCILVLFMAEITSWMFILCNDYEIQMEALYYGVSAIQLSWWIITLPENLSFMAPDMLVAMLIGILGVISIRTKVKSYTNPNYLQEKYSDVTVENNVSEFFIVQENKVVKIIYYVFGIGFILLSLVYTGIMIFVLKSLDVLKIGYIIMFFSISLLFLALGIFFIFNALRKIIVEDNIITYISMFNKTNSFNVSDIVKVVVTTNGMKLLSSDNKTLAYFKNNQDNAELMKKYLFSKNIFIFVK